jgi:hypothetical protein
MHRPGTILPRCGSNAGLETGDILADLLEVCQSVFSYSKYLYDYNKNVLYLHLLLLLWHTVLTV